MATSLLRGEAGYYSGRMTRDRALAFARMIEKHPAFRSAMVGRVPHAAEPRCWRVAYEPVSAEAYVRLLLRLQRERDERAEQQWNRYRVYATRLPLVFDVWNVVNHAQYETHLLDQEDSCSCPDALCRLQGCSLVRLACKHVAISAIHVELGMVRQPLVYGTGVQEARAAA